MSNYRIVNGELYHSDALMHKSFKYLKKELVNGKMRYYYHGPSVNGVTQTRYYKDTPGEYGVYENINKQYSDSPEYVNRVKSKKLLSDTYKVSKPDGSTTRVENVGLLEQGVSKIKETSSKTIDKAKKWLEKLTK